MGQAAVLPNPILPEGGNPDDLLARLAGEEIDRLIREAEGETSPPADPGVRAALSRAEPAATRLAAIADAADRSTVGTIEELTSSRAEVAPQAHEIESSDAVEETESSDPFLATLSTLAESQSDRLDETTSRDAASTRSAAGDAVLPLEAFGLDPMPAVEGPLASIETVEPLTLSIASDDQIAAAPAPPADAIATAEPVMIDQASALRDRMAALSAAPVSTPPISRPLDSADAVAREMALDEATRPRHAVDAGSSPTNIAPPENEVNAPAAASSIAAEPIAHSSPASADATAFAMAVPAVADRATDAHDALFDAANVAGMSHAVSPTSEALSAILDSTQLADAHVETEPKLAIWWVPLVWLNSPFAFLPESARAAIGKLGLVTLFNATAVLIYATVVKK